MLINDLFSLLELCPLNLSCLVFGIVFSITKVVTQGYEENLGTKMFISVHDDDKA